MKGWLVALIIVIVLAGAGFGAYSYITGSSETVAYLNIESGNVELNRGAGWQAATDQMQLKQKDSVRTLQDGQASIVFYESDIMELEPNTEVSLTQLVANSVAVNQKSGETWNRVSKLTGTRQYTVETPNSVATVRGTGFGVNVSEEGDEIIVDEGTVECSLPDRRTPRQIMEYKSCMVKNGQISEGEITKEQLLLMKRKIQTGIFVLKKMQIRELQKKGFLINALKKRYNMTDAEFKQFIERVDSGEVDLSRLKQGMPVRMKSLDKVVSITQKIVELNKRLQKIDEKLASME